MYAQMDLQCRIDCLVWAYTTVADDVIAGR